MKTIWRFQLPITDRPAIEMPAGARLLPSPNAHNGGNGIAFWAEVDTAAPPEHREFRIVGTGNHLPGDCGEFIGTVVTHGGVYVWHLYEAAR